VKDIIIRGGLYANPAVSEAVAMGLPDPILGEVVGAVVSLRQGFVGKVSETEILEDVKTRSV
jgi:acyl-coenzyme A synthetase/AMP-(fatty) acid ligase